MSEAEQAVVRRDAQAYVLELDGRRVGAAFVTERDGAVVFTHTEIDDEYAGQHLGSRLVAAALDDVRSRGERVVVRCPFVAAFIERHPEYGDLVT